ncbi:MAG: hypothetical protein AB8G11_25750 [Saprospiraceae bacterium]
MTNSVFLQRIPDDIYETAVSFLANEYHFLNGTENGGRMRLANYFVGVKSSLANTFIDFIQEILVKNSNDKFPKVTIPNGFEDQTENLTSFEKSGGFSFGSFDMAVTNESLQVIEFQAIATYPFITAKLNLFVQEQMKITNGYAFANDKKATWTDFINTYQEIMSGKEQKTLVITDRNLKNQKTNFEFFATQKELKTPVEIVDIEAIFEKNNTLFYKNEENEIKKIHRLYNRILPNEAIYDDDYPNGAKWQLRYNKVYQDLIFINHPKRLFEISKRLLPYIEHPFNPTATELETVAKQFLERELSYQDYVWKHKDGAAGFSLILSPTEKILHQLMEEQTLSDYIVQKKINYQIFKTDDGLDKIVELRFMTAHTQNHINVVPMARIGHCVQDENGSMIYKIHFGDNNRKGYGFAPVLIFED